VVLAISARAENDNEQLKQQVEQLLSRVQQLESSRTNDISPTAMQTSSPTQAFAMVRAGGSYMNIGFITQIDSGWSTDDEPSDRLELGDHDPQQRGFSLRNVEMAIDGSVDPYFKGFGSIVLKLDEESETEIELEEAYILTTSLPGNLQLKGGQFFSEFGRQNQQHPHAWAFVDQPLILNRVFGGEGMRNPGVRISWLAPTPFYTELMLGVLNGNGGTAYSFRNDEADFYGREPTERGIDNASDFLYVPRIVSSFELTEEQTLVFGASAALGPNDAGEDTSTQIYGADMYWKWRPTSAQGNFPFVSWQTEVLCRNYEVGEGESTANPDTVLPAETLEDWGYYSQVLWGFKPRWVVGLRGEQVWANNGSFEDDDEVRGDRTRISPSLTFYPSEFSKLRLQYNYDELEVGDDAHSIWLRVEFALGAHAAHKY